MVPPPRLREWPCGHGSRQPCCIGPAVWGAAVLGPRLGFMNEGNACYAIVVVHCIATIQTIVAALGTENWQGGVAGQLRELVLQARGGRGAPGSSNAR
eukprot:tig00021617_g22931.t1